ncbi:MAG: MCE family protein [Nitrosomonadales bacterium]|nr:MCE family protein [Nitrosomonadales bacterium]
MKLPNYNQRLLSIEKRTQRFMLGAIGVMLLVLAMIAARQDYFSRSTAIYFITPNAQGLSKGMAVKFIGFKVGSVQEVSMQPNATVRVKVSLDDEYVHLIGQDAKARLVKEALVGESVVEIIPGSQQVKQVTQNSVLEFERGQDAGAVVENLAAQLQPILGDIHQITSSINNPGGDVQQTLKNLNLATGGFRETVNQFTQLGVSSNQAMGRINSSLETLDKAIPKLVDKADTTLDNVQSATADIRKITNDSAGEIPSLVRNANALVQDGQETLGGVKKSWLLNSLFTEPEEQILPVDGYVAPTQP